MCARVCVCERARAHACACVCARVGGAPCPAPASAFALTFRPVGDAPCCWCCGGGGGGGVNMVVVAVVGAGYDLLKNKSDALTARFRGILREIKDVRCTLPAHHSHVARMRTPSLAVGWGCTARLWAALFFFGHVCVCVYVCVCVC